MWQHVFDEGEESYVFEANPFGVIIPHHMIAAYQLARFYEGLAKVKNPSVIVIVGPNHYENGEADIQTCLSCIYKTNEGDLNLELEYIQKMLDKGIAEKQDDTFINEHAIHAHTPYIKHYFPDARIVPILLQWEMPITEVEKLSEWLNDNLPEDALVLASVDFSHYIPAEAADFHDRSSFAGISNFDFQNIYDLEVDSPSSIYLILDLMKKRGYERAIRLEHTNLDQFLSKASEYSTSHQYFEFVKGEKQNVNGLGIMLIGKVGDLGIVDNWNWDRKERSEKDDPLYHLRGQEDRFLTGTDFLIFNPKDGCEEKTQNGMTVNICKENETTKINDIVINQDSIKVDSNLLSLKLANFVVGLYMTPNDTEIYFFAVDEKKKLLELADRKKAFMELIGNSDLGVDALVDYEKNVVKIPR